MPKIRPVIMCGGSGTRMWPESRESLPKQFIPLIGQRSTFQSIVSLVSDPAIFEPAVVITNIEYRFRVAEQLREIGAEAVILLEPDRRDSAADVGAAAAWAAAGDPKTVVAVLPGSGAATVSAMIQAATITRITGSATLVMSSWRDTIEPAAAKSNA